MDCQLPGMDGYQATERSAVARSVGAAPRSSRSPQTFRTTDRQRCLAAGMDDYLAKPLTQTELADVFARCGLRGSGTAASTPRRIFLERRGSDAPKRAPRTRSSTPRSSSGSSGSAPQPVRTSWASSPCCSSRTRWSSPPVLLRRARRPRPCRGRDRRRPHPAGRERQHRRHRPRPPLRRWMETHGDRRRPHRRRGPPRCDRTEELGRVRSALEPWSRPGEAS